MTSKVGDFNPINLDSLSAITGSCKEALVYGTTSCGWEWIQSQMRRREKSPITRVFNYLLGDDLEKNQSSIPVEAVTTLAGKPITKVHSGAEESPDNRVRTKRICKTALVNWAIEVWKRKDSHEQIPLIFAVDIEGNDNPPTAENMLSKTKVMRSKKVNDIITHAEIRRLAKLCTDETIDEEVRNAVKKNLHFVRLCKKGEELFLEKVKAPWDLPEWSRELEKRKAQKNSAPQGKKKYDWRRELNSAVAEERVKRRDRSTDNKESVLETPKKAEPAPKPPESVQQKKPALTNDQAARQAEMRLLEGLALMFGTGATPRNV